MRSARNSIYPHSASWSIFNNRKMIFIANANGMINAPTVVPNAITAATPQPTSSETRFNPVRSTRAAVAGPRAVNNKPITRLKPMNPTPTVRAAIKCAGKLHPKNHTEDENHNWQHHWRPRTIKTTDCLNCFHFFSFSFKNMMVDCYSGNRDTILSITSFTPMPDF